MNSIKKSIGNKGTLMIIIAAIGFIFAIIMLYFFGGAGGFGNGEFKEGFTNPALAVYNAKADLEEIYNYIKLSAFYSLERSKGEDGDVDIERFKEYFSIYLNEANRIYGQSFSIEDFFSFEFSENKLIAMTEKEIKVKREIGNIKFELSKNAGFEVAV